MVDRKRGVMFGGYQPGIGRRVADTYVLNFETWVGVCVHMCVCVCLWGGRGEWLAGDLSILLEPIWTSLIYVMGISSPNVPPVSPFLLLCRLKAGY